MNIFNRVKGLILSPKEEWETIEAEDKSIVDIYRGYVVYIALIPPFANWLSDYFIGMPHGREIYRLSLTGGLLRAAMQYALSLPLLYLVAFVISSIAPYFEGKADDKRALTLAAYSYTPAWLATGFALIPGLRILDILGFYGLYVLYFGLPRMMKCPQHHADVYSLAILVLTLATAALHAWIVHTAVPWQAFPR